MTLHLPAVHRLLPLVVALDEHHIDDVRVGDMPVLLELLADACTHMRRRHVQRVQGADLRRLFRKTDNVGGRTMVVQDKDEVDKIWGV